jgi:hypothetical protein
VIPVAQKGCMEISQGLSASLAHPWLISFRSSGANKFGPLCFFHGTTGLRNHAKIAPWKGLERVRILFSCNNPRLRSPWPPARLRGIVCYFFRPADQLKMAVMGVVSAVLAEELLLTGAMIRNRLPSAVTS